MVVTVVAKAHPAGLKQSSAKLLESYGVSINLDAIALRAHSVMDIDFNLKRIHSLSRRCLTPIEASKVGDDRDTRITEERQGRGRQKEIGIIVTEL